MGQAVFSDGARAKGPPNVSQILISSDEEGEDEDEEIDLTRDRLNNQSNDDGSEGEDQMGDVS